MTDINSAPTTSLTPTGEVDITNVVSALESTFVTWAETFIFGEAIATPGLQWLALPIISTIFKWALSGILNLLAGEVVMGAFFLNTAIKNASQAKGYVDAVTAKESLPPTASDADYAIAEQKEIAAFKSLVTLTS